MKWSIFDNENAELLDEIKNTYKITLEQFQEIKDDIVASKRKITSCLYEGKVCYDVGDKIGHNGCQYYVLEVGNNTEGNLQELIVGR